MLYKMPMAGKWRSWTDKKLLLQPEEIQNKYNDTWALYQANPLMFFLPHGGQADFINDVTSDMSIIYAGNQTGKTFSLLGWLGFRAVPTQPDWMCFTDHGINHIEWDGPKRIAIASYTLQTHCKKNIWDKLKGLLPISELREYSPLWCRMNGNKRARTVNWQTSPRVELACGTIIDFYGYHQSQEAFESMTYDLFCFDEQPKEEQFDGAFARGQTAEHYQTAAALTPHYVPGRPDTGAHGWIPRMTSGLLDKGMAFKVYNIAMEQIPDKIVSDKKKKQAYDKYIRIPTESGNQKKIRAGKARYFGLPESSEGLVFDNWNASVQLIDPFPVPVNWTRVRALDPGRVHPFGGLWGAVAPWGDLVIYREHYEAGLGMDDNVKQIIEKSGNTRRRVSETKSEDGYVIPIFEEVTSGERYEWTVMDSRAFSQPARETAMTQGMVFARMGINCIKASGMKSELAIPIAKEWFEPMPNRPHILVKMKIMDVVKDKDGKPLTNCPRLYVFNTCRNFRIEIEGYCNKPDSEQPEKGKDDLMNSLKYMLLQEPKFRGEYDYGDDFSHLTKTNDRFSYS